MSTILAELSSAAVSSSSPPAKKARVVELSDNPKVRLLFSDKVVLSC